MNHPDMGKINGFAFLLLFALFSCESSKPTLNQVSSAGFNTTFKTKNVLIVVFDGARYSETWGDATHNHIPGIARELAPKGCVYTRFYNNGPTYTTAGYAALLTGNYQEIDNNGQESPVNPSVLQLWEKKGRDKPAAWIITSKKKLEVLSDCADPDWEGCCRPAADCGTSGAGILQGNRDDGQTCDRAIDIMKKEKPQILVIGFMEPDVSGHSGNWESYVEGIKKADGYILRLWEYLQSDDFYHGKTTLFIVNDHGRHSDDVADGFHSHGDQCEGCRHLFMAAIGPDFEEGKVVETERELTDIPATVAKLLGMEMPSGKGEVMEELWRK